MRGSGSDLVLVVGCPLGGKTAHVEAAFGATHDVVRASYPDSLDRTFAAFVRLVQSGARRIVIDACNASRDDRERFVRVGKHLGYRVGIIFVAGSLTDAELRIQAIGSVRERRRQRARMQRYRDKFQFPSMAEKVDSIVRVEPPQNGAAASCFRFANQDSMVCVPNA
jgi:hypothetical protein